MMELQETQTTRYIIENAQKIIKNMFGKGLISFLSLYLSINIELDLLEYITVWMWSKLFDFCYSSLLLLFVFLAIVKSISRGMPFIIDFCTHWVQSFGPSVMSVQNVFGWSKKAFQIPKNRPSKMRFSVLVHLCQICSSKNTSAAYVLRFKVLLMLCNRLHELTLGLL